MESGAPGFWDDQERASATLRRLTGLRQEIGIWRGMSHRVGELKGLLEMAEDESDQHMVEEIAADTERIARELEQLEFQLQLSGPYDDHNAIIAIYSGAGGTESQDWAEMLLRMYLRWGERERYQTSILDLMQGDEAGIKSVTVEVVGPYAYGYLKAERGVHRLVRLSPYDAAHRRHTSFALMEVMPQVEEAVDVVIKPDDLRIDFFRASGAGGQNVQKTSTAVRITHIPTGIVVTCQNERSQYQNKETAMKILLARLTEMEIEKREQEKARLKGERVDAGWGNQIRSYVLHPYLMVKDHRSGYETSDANGVLDGDINAFIEAYLRAKIGST